MVDATVQLYWLEQDGKVIAGPDELETLKGKGKAVAKDLGHDGEWARDDAGRWQLRAGDSTLVVRSGK